MVFLSELGPVSVCREINFPMADGRYEQNTHSHDTFVHVQLITERSAQVPSLTTRTRMAQGRTAQDCALLKPCVPHLVSRVRGYYEARRNGASGSGIGEGKMQLLWPSVRSRKNICFVSYHACKLLVSWTVQTCHLVQAVWHEG